MFPPPPADGLVTHLQTASDFAVAKALCKQFHSFEPTLLQSHEVAPNASRIADLGLDTAKSIFFRYIMRDSVGGRPSDSLSGDSLFGIGISPTDGASSFGI